MLLTLVWFLWCTCCLCLVISCCFLFAMVVYMLIVLFACVRFVLVLMWGLVDCSLYFGTDMLRGFRWLLFSVRWFGVFAWWLVLVGFGCGLPVSLGLFDCVLCAFYRVVRCCCFGVWVRILFLYYGWVWLSILLLCLVCCVSRFGSV